MGEPAVSIPFASQMKNPLRSFAIIAAIFFVAACLTTGVPVGIKAVIALIVGSLGAVGLGIARAKMIYAVPLTAVYLFLAIIVPGYLARTLPGKSSLRDMAFVGIIECLIVSFVLFWSGRLSRIILERRRNRL